MIVNKQHRDYGIAACEGCGQLFIKDCKEARHCKDCRYERRGERRKAQRHRQAERAGISVSKLKKLHYQPHFTKGAKRRALKRDGYRCVWCGSTVDLTEDHIVPVRDGGFGTTDNLRTLCLKCHTMLNQVEAIGGKVLL